MIQRRPFSEAPAAVKELVDELEKDGDYLVYEDEQQQLVVSIVSAKAHRKGAACRLNALLDSFPTYPYSEEEVNADIEEAIQATKGRYPADARPKVTS